MNLAIKYRPSVLSEVKGHTKIIKELQKRSKGSDYPNSMLFLGKTGTGKTTLQLIVAKNILCLNKDDNGNCCNNCDVCNAINNEQPNNYCHIFNASNLGIDDMRNIENIAVTKTLSKAKSKVIIIDEMQELSSNKKAQKNILRLLERPLKNTYIILGSMDQYKVDKAIMNRCVKYNLDNLNEGEIGQYLIGICTKEKVSLKEEGRPSILATIVSNSNGSMRSAISHLERVIYSELWDSKDLFEELGILTEDKINLMVNDLMTGNIEVLKNKITEDVVNKITSVLILYYKVQHGYELEQWRKSYLTGLKKFPVGHVQYAIGRLLELLKFFYLTPTIIEFALVDIINYTKPLKVEPEQKRRRKPIE